jgi:hypothetical protein
MWEALRICLPITLMTFAIFARTDMVVNPGWAQIQATLVVLVGACASAFTLFGRFVDNALADKTLRIALAALAFVALFHPNGNVALAAAAVALPATIVGVLRHKRIASLQDQSNWGQTTFSH